MDQMFSKWQPTVLSLFRFITGLLLLQFGIAKIFKFPVVPYFANLPPLITGAGAIELVLGALLMIGLFTRISAFILSGEMAFAYFLGHMFKIPPSRCCCRSSITAPSRSCFASPVFISRPPAAARSASMRCATGADNFFVFANEAKQSRSYVAKAGLLRFARNDRDASASVIPASSIRAAPRLRILNCAAPATS